MKLRTILLAAILAVTGAATGAQAQTAPDLLILGSPHLANPNRDTIKTNVADVTTPERQREIEALIEALARYRPTRIAVEVQAKDQARLDERYAAYRAGKYVLTASEVDQIALRLAAKLNLPRIEAVDWNDMPPMAEADYDYTTWAEANGRTADLQTALAPLQATMETFQAKMGCTPVAEWYRYLNTADFDEKSNRINFEVAMLGEAGPNWVGGSWHMRNLKIFAQLRRVTQPGDRVLVLYGASHAFPLEQYALQSGAFTLSEPLDYLPKASQPGC